MSSKEKFMQRLRRWGLTLVAAFSLMATLLLLTGWGSAAAAKIDSVFISNSAANPVPVREQAVDANGNIKVAVQNSPAPGQPFQKRLSTSGQSGDFDVSASFTVPAGKRLIIQFASASVTLPVGQTASVDLFVPEDQVDIPLPLQAQGTTSNSLGLNNVLAAATQLSAYVDGGHLVELVLSRYPSSGGAVAPGGNVFLGGFVSGYLVNAP
jgi:hypothetical protein